MAKALGYILALIGIAGLGISLFPEFKTALPDQIATLTNTTLMIISAALILTGLFLIWRSSGKNHSQKAREVPIFKGKQVVGYRQN